MLRDSVWTYLRKARRDHPDATLEQQQQHAEQAGYNFSHRLTPPAPETQFRCYDPVYAQLQQGQTLSLMAVRQLVPGINIALHQDQRFYDLTDGSWYLAEQHLINDDLAQYLHQVPHRQINLAAYLGSKPNSTFCPSDPRFRRVGADVLLLIPASDLEPAGIQAAQAWLEEQTEVQLDTLTHPDFPPVWWQAYVQAALTDHERFLEVTPGYWAESLPPAPSLDDLHFIRLSLPPSHEIIYPPFPDPPVRQERRHARFRLTVGRVELRLGYLTIPGAWQSAFTSHQYPVVWQDETGQTQNLMVFTEGGLLYGDELHKQLLLLGLGGQLLIEKSNQIHITVQGWDTALIVQESNTFTPADLHLAQTQTLQFWTLELQDGVVRAPQLLLSQWQNQIDRPLTLADYRVGFLSPGVERSPLGFRWIGIDWQQIAALLTPITPEELDGAGDTELLADLFAPTWEDSLPLPSSEIALADVLPDLDFEPASLEGLFADFLPMETQGSSAPGLELDLTPDLADLLINPPEEQLPLNLSDPVAPIVLSPVLTTVPLEDLFSLEVAPLRATDPSATVIPSVAQEVLFPELALADLGEEHPDLGDLLDETTLLQAPDILEATDSMPEANYDLDDLDLGTGIPMTEQALFADLVSDDLQDLLGESMTFNGELAEQTFIQVPETPIGELSTPELEFPLQEPEPDLTLVAPHALHDLIPLLEVPLDELAPTHDVLLAQLTQLSELLPPKPSAPHWFSLLADLRQKTEVSLPDLAMVEALWWGEYHQRQYTLPTVIAQSRVFFGSQLPLALLPLSGSLHDLRRQFRELYDCGDRDPTYALTHLILPALGYRGSGEGWSWEGLGGER